MLHRCQLVESCPPGKALPCEFVDIPVQTRFPGRDRDEQGDLLLLMH